MREEVLLFVFSGNPKAEVGPWNILITIHRCCDERL
jgi:hypothetical protein